MQAVNQSLSLTEKRLNFLNTKLSDLDDEINATISRREKHSIQLQTEIQNTHEEITKMEHGADFIQQERDKFYDVQKTIHEEMVKWENEVGDVKDMIVQNQKHVNDYQYKLNQRTEELEEITLVLKEFGPQLEKGECLICY